MRTPNDPRAALALLLSLAALPLAAQAPAAAAPPAGQVAAAGPATLPAGDVYRREVFRYLRGGRPDPFSPLLSAADLGFRVEDLRLTSIIFSPDGRGSIAVFAEGDSARRYRLHQGQRLGTMTVLRIWPQRVDVRVDEFGGSRLQTVLLQRAQRQEPAQQAAQAPGQPQQFPVTITQPPAQAQAARVLRRGSSAASAGVSAQAPGPAPAPRPAPAQPAARPVNPSSPNYTTQARPR